MQNKLKMNFTKRNLVQEFVANSFQQRAKCKCFKTYFKCTTIFVLVQRKPDKMNLDRDKRKYFKDVAKIYCLFVKIAFFVEFLDNFFKPSLA